MRSVGTTYNWEKYYDVPPFLATTSTPIHLRCGAPAKSQASPAENKGVPVGTVSGADCLLMYSPASQDSSGLCSWRAPEGWEPRRSLEHQTSDQLFYPNVPFSATPSCDQSSVNRVAYSHFPPGENWSQQKMLLKRKESPRGN